MSFSSHQHESESMENSYKGAIFRVICILLKAGARGYSASMT